MYPHSLLISDAEEAASRIRAVAALEGQQRAGLRLETHREARRRFDGLVVLPRLEAAIPGRVVRSEPAAAPAAGPS